MSSVFKDELVPAARASEAVGGVIAPQTFANWRYQGRGPRFVKIGNRVFYPASELRKLVVHTFQSTSEYSTRDSGT